MRTRPFACSGFRRVSADLEQGLSQQPLEVALTLEQCVVPRLEGIELLLELIPDRFGAGASREAGEQVGDGLPRRTHEGDIGWARGGSGREEDLARGAAQWGHRGRTGGGLPRAGRRGLEEGRQGFEQLVLRGTGHVPS